MTDAAEERGCGTPTAGGQAESEVGGAVGCPGEGTHETEFLIFSRKKKFLKTPPVKLPTKFLALN